MKTRYFLAALGAGAALAARRMNRTPFGLRGKVVLITGASRGHGLAVARLLATEGARLAIVARDPAELRVAEEELADRGGEVLALSCDVRDPEQVRSVVGQVTERFGRLDALINNAGVIQVGPVDNMALADYQEAMAVNFWGPLHFMLAARDIMRAQGGGRIVNISSIGGKVAFPHLVPYASSKFALLGLSEGWRAELLQQGIIVSTVCPNLMRTGSPRNADFKGQHEKEYLWFALGDNLPGLSQSAEAVAREVVSALVHGKAEVVTGLPAQLMATFHALFPGQTTNILSLVNRFLPAPGGVGTQTRKGFESETSLTQNFPIKQRAEVAHNQR